MACSLCDYTREDGCADCGECCQCRCDDPVYCYSCGEPNCPGYCDDYQTYNLRPAETGGAGR